MRNDLVEKIYADFPLIFPPDRRGSPRTSCMFWGLDCGDGWYSIIHECCAHLQFRTDQDPGAWPQIVAAQIKEKFGTLRFYIEGYEVPEGADEKREVEIRATVRTIVSAYESMSGFTCERCGTTAADAGVSTKAGGIASPGWVRTLCEDCRSKPYPRE